MEEEKQKEKSLQLIIFKALDQYQSRNELELIPINVKLTLGHIRFRPGTLYSRINSDQ